jgi:hypothetical protein
MSSEVLVVQDRKGENAQLEILSTLKLHLNDVLNCVSSHDEYILYIQGVPKNMCTHYNTECFSSVYTSFWDTLYIYIYIYIHTHTGHIKL